LQLAAPDFQGQERPRRSDPTGRFKGFAFRAFCLMPELLFLDQAAAASQLMTCGLRLATNPVRSPSALHPLKRAW
jgi:hypothetical protein